MQTRKQKTKYAKKWREEHPERNGIYYRKLKNIIFDHYGRKCMCSKCPENNSAFMTLDHKNNDGAKHRKIGRAQLFLKIIKDNFPDIYQTLCYNCNCARRFNNGICPHNT